MLKKSKIKISSNRSFGIVFFVFFTIIGIYPVISNGDVNIYFLISAIIFLILGILNSKILYPLNYVWFKFGLLLGLVIGPIVMGIIFFAVVTPTGLIMRLIGKDLLNKKFLKKNETYWIKREKIKSSMKQQF
tara:strand:- start:21 stop:416 length:396 start_codon:yes stop_codon:yes gene_type:complete